MYMCLCDDDIDWGHSPCPSSRSGDESGDQFLNEEFFNSDITNEYFEFYGSIAEAKNELQLKNAFGKRRPDSVPEGLAKAYFSRSLELMRPFLDERLLEAARDKARSEYSDFLAKPNNRNKHREFWACKVKPLLKRIGIPKLARFA